MRISFKGASKKKPIKNSPRQIANAKRKQASLTRKGDLLKAKELKMQNRQKWDAKGNSIKGTQFLGDEIASVKYKQHVNNINTKQTQNRLDNIVRDINKPEMTVQESLNSINRTDLLTAKIEIDRFLSQGYSPQDQQLLVTNALVNNKSGFIESLDQISKVYPDIKFRKAVRVIKDTANPQFKAMERMAGIITTGLNTLSASISTTISQMDANKLRTERAIMATTKDMFNDYLSSDKQITVPKDPVDNSNGNKPEGWL